MGADSESKEVQLRNISFALTTEQFRNRTKTVTRRLKWEKLKAGDLLCGVVKGMGLKPGEEIQRLGVIRVMSVRRECLSNLDHLDVRDEGFPAMTPREFVGMFCKHMGCDQREIVTVIEFKYIPGGR